MDNYEVRINYYGEIHTIYTKATNEISAKNNAIYKLAQALKRDVSFVRRHFWNGDKITAKIV